MKLMAVLALACGFIAAPMTSAGIASGSPCYGVDCFMYVAHGVEAGGPCVTGTRYIFGMDASGNTLVCGSKSQWKQSPPLVGVRTNRAPCTDGEGVAQSPDGMPLSCVAGSWNPDYTATFY